MRSLVLILLMVFVGALAACQSEPPKRVLLKKFSTAGDVEHLAGATQAQWQADFKRMADDIRRAAKQSHWGVLHVRKPVTQKFGDRDEQVITAEMMLPDARQAWVHSRTSGDKRVVVTVRVGHFGDPKSEKEFLNTLAVVLDGKPKRKRDRGFKLPERKDNADSQDGGQPG